MPTKTVLEDSLEKIEKLDINPIKTAYTLTYKVRQVVGKLNFYMPSDSLEDAMTRGKKHCEIQRYKFIRVDPMFSNIDELDRKREENDLA